ncbi:MAG: DNA N-6-adenine-methyltransferase [Pseudomonadota bacterium]|nr:DNA N-6-adenine-methyltransferase [Pseudomonadota bacterium]
MFQGQMPSQSGDWYTPAWVFQMLGCRFALDVAAPPEGPRHVPCDFWISEGSLDERWYGFVWMNAPFGGRNGLTPWLEKFVAHGNGIALVPDRTSAPWFRDYARRVDIIAFLPKVKFERPDGTTGASPANGCALFGIGAKAVGALWNVDADNGWIALPRSA